MHFLYTLYGPNRESLEFHFFQSYTVYGRRYFIEVFEADKKLYKFKMKKENNKWIMIGPTELPNWVWNLESTLSDIIKIQKK